MLFTNRFERVYVERSIVRVERGRIVIVGPEDRRNFPHKNAQVLVLGKGTSITHEAVSQLALEGVQVVWSGAGGMPYLCSGVTQYHPTELQRKWALLWGEDGGHLEMAKSIFGIRMKKAGELLDPNIVPVDQSESWIQSSRAALTLPALLGVEGNRLNWLYSCFARHHGLSFNRDHDATDPADSDPAARVNAYLSHGNALAYGVAAGAMWHLGLSPAYPLVHGLTRNGGLIFDAADLIKDSIVLPWAFDCYRLPVAQAMYELRHRIKRAKGDQFIMDTLSALPDLVVVR